MEPEEVMSINEQMTPAKTRRSGIRQYNPKMTVKWGFKKFIRADSSGMIYDFFLYSSTENCSSERSVSSTAQKSYLVF